MSLLQAIIMGIIQGVTEFLPVSSSGHLAIFKILFHMKTDTGLLFDVILHLGTLIAIFAVYYKDIFSMIVEGCSIVRDSFINVVRFFRNKCMHEQNEYIKIVTNGYRKFVLLVLVSTIPTGIIGLVASDLVTMASEILIIPGICLIGTSILLFISDRIHMGNKGPKNVSYTNGFIIGICQGIATLPGLSRSGTTIAACLISGFDRRFAVKYSFIMSIPAVLGATILELKDFKISSVTGTEILYYLIGMAVAAFVGYICIKTMLVIVRKKKFTIFSIYCLIVGLMSIGGYFYMA
ncbi:MAG: undecaprenyl-diphosphate phosphatase [Lachnospiraceae bacterium]|jgi:undecaprenyl-diphosphatase|nr:undecaprenyl-diphosphate phosphatase [Lachnospiraceae bacterium]